MLRIRLMGTRNEIKWFRKMLLRDKRIHIRNMSNILDIDGPEKYKRMYAEVRKSTN